MDDPENMTSEEIATFIARGTAVLARRAGASSARPVQLDLIPPDPPIDPTSIDWDEQLASGRRRYVPVKVAAMDLRYSEDSLIRRAKNDGIGFQLGGPRGRWIIDIRRAMGRV